MAGGELDALQRKRELLRLQRQELLASLRRNTEWFVAYAAAHSGIPPPRGPPSTHHLSPRERQIVELVLQARQVKDIATLLNLRPRTVSYYLTKLYAKLDVHSLGELARWGRQQEDKTMR